MPRQSEPEAQTEFVSKIRSEGKRQTRGTSTSVSRAQPEIRGMSWPEYHAAINAKNAHQREGEQKGAKARFRLESSATAITSIPAITPAQDRLPHSLSPDKAARLQLQKRRKAR